MVSVEETELPGLGWKYALQETDTGDRFVIVVHHSGKRELYHFARGEETPREVITLTDEESRKLGAILIGAYLRPQRPIAATVSA